MNIKLYSKNLYLLILKVGSSLFIPGSRDQLLPLLELKKISSLVPGLASVEHLVNLKQYRDDQQFPCIRMNRFTKRFISFFLVFNHVELKMVILSQETRLYMYLFSYQEQWMIFYFYSLYTPPHK